MIAQRLVSDPNPCSVGSPGSAEFELSPAAAAPSEQNGALRVIAD
jgi:hypothetical protein